MNTAPAPAQRVVIHVGTPKSGTTYLQDTMWESRAALLDAGVLYPGDRREDHFWAVVDLRNDGYLDGSHPAVPGAWARIVEAARAHPGTTVISHELLGDRSAEDVERVMADLDFAELHVVATARDLARQLPSSWQSDLRNRHHMTFSDWLAGVRPGSNTKDAYARLFWLRQDLPGVLRRWRADLPAERVHVVTVPRRSADPSTLWTRFARTLGVNPGVVQFLEGRRNTSLGWVEAEFLRRFNERAAHSIPWSKYPSTIIEHVVNNVLCQRPGALPVSLPAAERGWVTARADAMIAELAETGYHVIGDLEELRSAATDDLEVVPAVSDTQVLDAALNAIVAAFKDDTNQSAAPSGQSRSDFSEAVERERHNMSCPYPGYANDTTTKPAE